MISASHSTKFERPVPTNPGRKLPVGSRPVADIAMSGHRDLMELRYRHAELLSPDAKLRLVIYDRADQRFQIVEERVRSWEAGGEWHIVPFPAGVEWQAFWQINQQPRDGLFGTIEDALREAKLLLSDDS